MRRCGKGQTFLTAHQIEADVVRRALDEFVLRELIGVSDLPDAFKQLAVLRSKLGEEPSFNGRKGAASN